MITDTDGQKAHPWKKKWLEFFGSSRLYSDFDAAVTHSFWRPQSRLSFLFSDTLGHRRDLKARDLGALQRKVPECMHCNVRFYK
jgi:hypothetical protein